MKLGSVYIIGFGDPEMVKIGVSNAPFDRMTHLIKELKIENINMFISRKSKYSYDEERVCHDMLFNSLLGGLGEKKKYKREIFKYKFIKATWIIRNIMNDRKSNSFYKSIDDSIEFWSRAKLIRTYQAVNNRCKSILDDCNILYGIDKLKQVRKYRDPRTGEKKITVEIEF